jgi:hypothetical protein
MGNKELVEYLFYWKADVNKNILRGYTALCYVSYIYKSLINTKYINK